MGTEVVTYGDLVSDLLLPIPQLPLCANEHQMAHGLYIEPGGMGNFLIMASRLGLKAAPLAVLGDDFYAQTILEKLAQEGIDTSTVISLPGKQTTLALVFMSDEQEHTFLGVLGSVQITADLQTSLLEKISQSHAFYTNGYAFLEAHPPQLVVEAMQFAHRTGVPVYFDPGPLVNQLEKSLMADAIAHSDGLLLTHEEAVAWVGQLSPEQAAQELLLQGPAVVVIKLGAGGCLWAGRDEMINSDAFQVEVHDTSGAGDAFDAACLYGILRGLPARQTVQLANAVGGATVSKVGTGSRLPSKTEILDLLKRESINIPLT
jgi:sugar/nucleoside kinase (ribokinase family)